MRGCAERTFIIDRTEGVAVVGKHPCCRKHRRLLTDQENGYINGHFTDGCGETEKSYPVPDSAAGTNGEKRDRMNVLEMMDELQKKALKDETLRRELLSTRTAQYPLEAFCQKCRELGYEIYEVDLISAGEEFYAEMKRSTNGGGENSPMLEGEDDFYEMFFASLERA